MVITKSFPGFDPMGIVVIRSRIHYRMRSGYLETTGSRPGIPTWRLAPLYSLTGLFTRRFLNHKIDGYGSIPINTIFRGMNIHLPAILM